MKREQKYQKNGSKLIISFLIAFCRLYISRWFLVFWVYDTRGFNNFNFLINLKRGFRFMGRKKERKKDG